MFAVSAAQLAIAKRAPEAFRDGIVTERGVGSCVIDFLDGTIVALRVFEAPADKQSFSVGDPVAFHDEAQILAEHELWISARLLVRPIDSEPAVG